MKKIILVTFLILKGCLILAQNQELIDSLTAQIKLKPDGKEKVNLLLNLGYEYEIIQPSKSENLYLQALSIAQSMNNMELIANCYENLGINYQNGLSYYDSSKSCYKKCITARAKVYGEKSNEYAQSLNNLAELMRRVGDYSTAEPLFYKALEIYKEVSGLKHKNYALALNNLAVLYFEIGNYDAAVVLFAQAKDIWKDVLGEKHPDYGLAINNLASIYKTIGNFEMAEKLFQEAKFIDEENYGTKHPYYAQTLNNLGVVYNAMRKYADAETMFKESIEIKKEVLGKNHPSYARSLNNLANLYIATGEYKVAEQMALEAKAILQQTFGDYHVDNIFATNNLANAYMLQKNFISAGPVFIKNLEVIHQTISNNFSFLSEKEKDLFFKTKEPQFSSFFSFAMKAAYAEPLYRIEFYNTVLKNKGLLLKSSTAMRKAILNSNDTILINKYNQWTDLKKEIDKLNQTEVSKRKNNLNELIQQANTLEKELVKSSQIFSDFEKMQKLTWENVKNNLAPSEVAIEFIRFEEKKDTIIYCALIVNHDSNQPEIIKLCEEYKLASVVKKLTDNDQSNVNYIYGIKDNVKNQLYQLIWSPLEKQLENIKTVYYSPDGLLHKISFAAIGDGKNGYLINSYNLKQQSSTGKIASPELFSIEKDILAGIYGGIEYSTDTTSMKLWNYLPGTLNETIKIEQIFKTKNLKTNFLVGLDASEKKFKETAINCNLLHISTHGFFYPDQENLKTTREKMMADLQYGFLSKTNSYGLYQFVKNKNPLMRSGLAFAYANNVWNQRFPSEGEDGVLTANEVAQLDLQKTQLVVLSACETGLGDIKGSEGVYGLQRAFKMAGVKYIIMSLWQVPDKETVEFMTTFYSKLLKQRDVRKSFTETQKIMQKKYDPYYWAAFVLVE